MMTGELKSKIDSLWEIFWTGGLTNPLDVIEQMTYLMFIHDLDEADNTRAKESAMLGLPYESMFSKEVRIGDRVIDGSQLKWSVFHDFPAGRMYAIMQEWVFPFIKTLHGNRESAYSKYMDDAIFKIPTPLMLDKIVTAMDAIYAQMAQLQSTDVRGDAKRDLEKWFNLMQMRTSLKDAEVDKHIAGRYYQEGAVKAVCTSFDEGNRRKALLVMATGSGKTRTVIALCKVLLEHGWVRDILFLADRNSLVTQAKRSFVNLLPDLSVTNLCEEKDNLTAHCVFSTYQTMMNCIDAVRDEEGKLFTCGHFDLIICDEAHRSIYNKYRDIFTYFDAPLVGLTATPKDDIDKNTYEIFELGSGTPTYGYELAQAVKDGYGLPQTAHRCG